jgi:hypothetical protein
MTCQIRSIVTVSGKKSCGDKKVKKSGKFQCYFNAHFEVTIILSSLKL